MAKDKWGLKKGIPVLAVTGTLILTTALIATNYIVSWIFSFTRCTLELRERSSWEDDKNYLATDMVKG
ncbi:hypothetical protein [Microbulbifer epialgicus]|uniref:Uncharacterized protein n=1 Tax=Microbulbifer epialgicus TaxID=393907 RepID=A0ABV4NTZ1_9GAMM